MLQIGGKDVLYSGSFLARRDEEVELTVPSIIQRKIKVVVRKAEVPDGSAVAPTVEVTDEHAVVILPAAGEGVSVLDQTQLGTKKGPVSLRISAQPIGVFSLVHLDVLEGRYDNYVAE